MKFLMLPGMMHLDGGLAAAGRWLIVGLAVALPLQAEENGAEDRVTDLPTVAVAAGRVTVIAVDISLQDLLHAIGKEAGIEVSANGDLVAQVTKTFADVPLEEAIRRLLDRNSSVMLYAEPDQDGIRKLREIRVYSATTTAFHEDLAYRNVAADATEPLVLPRKKLVPRAASGSVETNRPQDDEDDPVDTLKRVLAEDDDPAERYLAAVALSFVGGQKAVDGLAAGLADKDNAVLEEVIESLGNIDLQDSSLLLSQVVLGDPRPEFRKQALRALAAHKSEFVTGFLKHAATSDWHAAVRSEANRLLDSLGAKEH